MTKKVRLHHCKHCGKMIERGNRKYCPECSIIADKEGNRRRLNRFREKHGNESAKKWNQEHPEERRLIARNYIHRHKEELSLKLKEWRRKNPEKVREQNKRYRKAQRRREERRMCLEKGIYKTVKKTIVCPKCNHKWRTKAKRPQCKCNYFFPRDYLETLVDETKTKPCKCCGREIPYQGRGSFRKYCECCFPQIQALKRVLFQMKYKKKNPNHFKEWYKNNHEVIVAVTCRVCGTIVPYKRIGKVPQKCGVCKGVERSRPKPIWNPKDIKKFIDVEKWRIGLGKYKKKKWNAADIKNYYEYWDARSTLDTSYLAVTNEE